MVAKDALKIEIRRRYVLDDTVEAHGDRAGGRTTGFSLLLPKGAKKMNHRDTEAQRGSKTIVGPSVSRCLCGFLFAARPRDPRCTE